jgi:hypothetical protein
MNEERTGKCWRKVEHIRGHLWHRYSIRNGYFSVSWIKSLLIWSPLTLVKKHKFIILAPTLYEYEMWNNFKWLGWPLWNICVTNDHGYVPLFVNTSRNCQYYSLPMTISFHLAVSNIIGFNPTMLSQLSEYLWFCSGQHNW